jgi:glutamate-1-semialdehyde 2,1-aminomutase
VNDELAYVGETYGIQVFRGSELDVLERYAAAARTYPADAYVRVTGDCPLVDADLVDQVVSLFWASRLDYARTGLSFPDGLDVEVFKALLLFDAATLARESYDREHVTPFIRRSAAENSDVLEHDRDYSRLRLTVDEPEDFDVIEGIFDAFGHNHFDFADVAQLIETQPQLFVANQHIVRDEGSMMGTGQKLWRRAKNVIPGGSMLFSKKAELFSQAKWPAYFSRSQGCRVWDLDGNSFIDAGYMGVGTNILGYRHPLVDEAVKGVVESGNLTTLNGPEEVRLAERLCEIHPWADMARFTRSGGEACAVAIRIARASSGKDGVAICGYHGWHDWYLSANLGHDTALDTHLLPGLNPSGVPAQLAGLVRPFEYNNLEQLHSILVSGTVGTVFMEVQRNILPAPGFLQGVVELAHRYGAVVVFDECTSGFREVLGGMHLLHGVEPDIAILGKTLGNGYAINAVIGSRAVMKSAEATFISSTFWSERIGPAAALASLAAMEAEEAPRRVHAIGLEVRTGWEQAAAIAGLEIAISGLPALSTYSVTGYDGPEVKTFIVERMLEKGYLAPPAFYASLAHTREIVQTYLSDLADVFQALAAIDPDDLLRFLPDGVAQSGFVRMN